MAVRLRISSCRYSPTDLLPACPCAKGSGRPEPHPCLSHSHPAFGNRASHGNFPAGHQNIRRSRQPDSRCSHSGALSRAWRFRICNGGSGLPEVPRSPSHQSLHVVQHREALGKHGALPGWSICPASNRLYRPQQHGEAWPRLSRCFPAMRQSRVTELSVSRQFNPESGRNTGPRPSLRNGCAPACPPTGLRPGCPPRPLSGSGS